ncbi:MAG: hypothetical protein B6241_03790 [Spirochaetaceae bacterium 4572_59]|nr:MAG: hypothetical protein B6241_03790 [Spirochaetaceae bacterium 4572_59]
MSTYKSSAALHYSMAEFAWILFFLASAASIILYAEELRLQDLNRELLSQNESLIEEVDDLSFRLAEKENAVMPCWKRPDSLIPEIVGTIIIEGSRMIRFSHYSREETVLTLSREDSTFGLSIKVRAVLLKQFQWEREYAAQRNCYLRMKIINHTERYSLYQEVAEVLNGLGIVVVQE